MPSLTTLYRAAVMVAGVTMAYQGWKHFGPSTEQAKSLAVQAADLVSRAWNEARATTTERSAALDPRQSTPPAAVQAPALTVEAVPPATRPSAVVLPPTPAPLNAPAELQIAAPPLSAVTAPVVEPQQQEITPVVGTDGEADHLKSLYSQLEQLGAHNPELKAWGTSGQFYRFRCSASLVDSPALSRHFESVAAEPVIAIEEVVAAIDAWRTAQRRSNLPR